MSEGQFDDLKKALQEAYAQRDEEIEKNKELSAKVALLEEELSAMKKVAPQKGSFLQRRSSTDRQKEPPKKEHEADVEVLLAALQSNMGFENGRPVAATIIFRCLLEWGAFQADRTNVFDRIMQTMVKQVEVNQDDNNCLAYWLSNIVALCHLLHTHIKPAERRSSWPSMKQSPEAVPKIGTKYNGLMFQKQIDALVQRIFPLLRDNAKRKIVPYLPVCVYKRPSKTSDSDVVDPHADPLSPWNHVVSVFDDLLNALQVNHVPGLLVQMLFEQLFSYLNTQVFNQQLLRPEMNSSGNAEYINSGLQAVEEWIGKAGVDWTGASWNNLVHLRQANAFLATPSKYDKLLPDIMKGICPDLSIHQLYRLGRMHVDTSGGFGMDTLSQNVLTEMKILMAKGVSSGALDSFLLDDDSTIPFRAEDVAKLANGRDLLWDVVVPQEMKDMPSFVFLKGEINWAAYL